MDNDNAFASPLSDGTERHSFDDSGNPDIAALLQPLAKVANWICFLSVLMFIYAAMYTLLTLGIAIIITWLPLWIGIIMWKVQGTAKEAHRNGDSTAAYEAIERVALLFKIWGIVTLVSMLLGFLVPIIMIAVGVSLGTAF